MSRDNLAADICNARQFGGAASPTAVYRRPPGDTITKPATVVPAQPVQFTQRTVSPAGHSRTASHADDDGDAGEDDLPKEKAPRRQPSVLQEQATQQKQNTVDSTDNTLSVVVRKDEARVDSRLLALNLGNQHKAVMALVERYADSFRGMGKLPFQMEPLPSGQRERFALLNEDQALFLLSLSRNTPRVVALKAKLVMAFRGARHAAAMRVDYLPGYHELHEQLHVLADGSPNERWAHINLNRLANKVAGIEPGERAQATAKQLARLVVAQDLAATAMRGAHDHHDGYTRAKVALAPLMAEAAPQLIGGA